MRLGFAVAMAVCLAGSPAMADMTITTDHDAAHHEDRADQERNAAHRDMEKSHEHAATAREEQNRRDHDADRHGGVHVDVDR